MQRAARKQSFGRKIAPRECRRLSKLFGDRRVRSCVRLSHGSLRCAPPAPDTLAKPGDFMERWHHRNLLQRGSLRISLGTH